MSDNDYITKKELRELLDAAWEDLMIRSKQLPSSEAEHKLALVGAAMAVSTLDRLLK